MAINDNIKIVLDLKNVFKMYKQHRLYHKMIMGKVLILSNNFYNQYIKIKNKKLFT